MFTHIKMTHEYSLSTIQGATITQNLKMDNYDDDTVNVTDYLISQTPNNAEQLFVYSTGLVIYWKVSASKVIIRTNGIFEAGKDGNLHLINIDTSDRL
ncbi:hypothetical protein [Limosilactobacillus vaginalis]|uniref:hypothetical protein n=1 Tax=Limosilactobacillus vaginalis TaxID=1633 RepID=UPI00360C60BF